MSVYKAPAVIMLTKDGVLNPFDKLRTSRELDGKNFFLYNS